MTAPCVVLTAVGLAAVIAAEPLNAWVLLGVATAAAWAAGACWDRCHAPLEER